MENPDTVFISETLAAMAFYYGLAGGLIACAIVLFGRVAYHRVRSLFQWR